MDVELAERYCDELAELASKGPAQDAQALVEATAILRKITQDSQSTAYVLERATEVDPKFLEPEYPFEWAGAYPLPAGEGQLAAFASAHPSIQLELIKNPDILAELGRRRQRRSGRRERLRCRSGDSSTCKFPSWRTQCAHTQIYPLQPPSARRIIRASSGLR